MNMMWLKDTIIFVLASIGFITVVRLLILEMIKLVGTIKKFILKIIEAYYEIKALK
jgi:hypothetical protein